MARWEFDAAAGSAFKNRGKSAGPLRGHVDHRLRDADPLQVPGSGGAQSVCQVSVSFVSTMAAMSPIFLPATQRAAIFSNWADHLATSACPATLVIGQTHRAGDGRRSPSRGDIRS
jgi:hypothetical protein